jgi:hypothetical protein
MTQWYLCEIDASPSHEEERLKKTDNLSVRYPDIFVGGITALLGGADVVENNKSGEGSWYIWLPIIPRVGDTLQFAGWQVEVSKVVLITDWTTKTGIQEGLFTSARITIRDNIVPGLTDAYFSIDGQSPKGNIKWEDFARRGHDLEYYAWELQHLSFVVERNGKMDGNYRWHTRIRPVAGDIISVQNKRWKVTSVELASADASVDGWLTIELTQ